MDILKGRKRAQSTSTLRPPTGAPTSPSSGLSAWVRRARSKSPHPASASSSPRTEPAPLPSVAAVTVASNTTTASTPESPKPLPATPATIENTPKPIPSPALVSPRAPTVTGTPPGRPPTHWWSQSPIERTRRAWDDDPDAEERWTRTRDRVDDALRRVLDTTASVTHEGLAISIDLLQLVPFPGLAEAAKTLLYIWDGVQLVDLNRMQCLRITERCANILISVRDEVVEATQHDNGIPADLEYPLRRLVDAFAQIQAFLNQQAHRPFIKRYLKRDDILRQLQGCDAALQDAVDAFGFSVQFRIYRYVRMLDADRRGRIEGGSGAGATTGPLLQGGTRPLLAGGAGHPTNALGLENTTSAGSDTTPRMDTTPTMPETATLGATAPAHPAGAAAARTPVGTHLSSIQEGGSSIGYPATSTPSSTGAPTTARDILAPLELELSKLEAHAANAAEAMGKERAEWVAVKDPLSSNGASDEAPPGSPFARPADAEPDTQDLDPSVVAARLRARRARENAEDTRRDVADLRGVMRKAMEIPNDAALMRVLEVDGAEIPEAVRALQRALEGALRKVEGEKAGLSRDGSLADKGGAASRRHSQQSKRRSGVSGAETSSAGGAGISSASSAEGRGRGRRRGTVDSARSTKMGRTESLASNAASTSGDVLRPAFSRRGTSGGTVMGGVGAGEQIPEGVATGSPSTSPGKGLRHVGGYVQRHPSLAGGVGMAETPSAGSTTGIKSGFVGRKVWKEGVPSAAESASAGLPAGTGGGSVSAGRTAEDRDRTVSGTSTEESFVTASSAGEGGETLGEDAGYDTEPDDLDDYAEEEQDPDPYAAHDMLDREFMESGIDAMRRMSRPGVAGGAVGGWGHEQGRSTGSGVRKSLPGNDAVVQIEGQSSMLQPWDLPDWTITRYEIDREIKIGVGYFSDVYKGTWKGRAVAIKVLAPTTPRKLFVREAGIWRGLRHRNVLQLFGASSAVEGGMWFLVSPYLPNGTLVEYLKRVESRIAAGLEGPGSPRLGGQASPRLGATSPRRSTAGHAKLTTSPGSPIMEAGTARAGGFALSSLDDSASAHQRTMSLDRQSPMRPPGPARQDSLSVGLLRASLEAQSPSRTPSSSSSASTTPTSEAVPSMPGPTPPTDADEDPADVLRYLLEIARGMEYLHSKGVLHGDLKAANVLVDDNHHAVISDFGQSEMRSEVYRISGLGGHGHGTLRWQAPELLSGATERITTETDVYAFAITAVEVLGFGRLPWGQLDDEAVRWAVLTNDARPQVPGISAHGTPTASSTPTSGHASPASPVSIIHAIIPSHTTPVLLALLRACWARDPFKRPMFSQVVRDVKRLRKQAGWIERSEDKPSEQPPDALTNEEMISSMPSPDLKPMPLPGGMSPRPETVPLGAINVPRQAANAPDLAKTPPGNAVGVPPGQAATLWGTPPAGRAGAVSPTPAPAGGSGLSKGHAVAPSQSDSTTYATAPEGRNSSGGVSSKPAVSESPEGGYYFHMEESVSMSSSSSTSDEGLLREAGVIGGPPMHMPEPVLYTSSSRASSLFMHDEGVGGGMGMSDSVLGPMVAGLEQREPAGGADYAGYESPPPATEMLAEIKNERRYRLLLNHEYHPSLNLPLWTPTPVEVGAVGYLSKPSGRFVTLFNAFAPDHAEEESVRGLPSVSGYGTWRVGVQQVEKRGIAQRGLDAIVGFLTYKSRGGGASSESISRRYSYPLRSGHKVAYLCTETATYRYLYSADAAKRWFVNNVDAVVRAYGRDHHIGKEDLFFVVGTLDAPDHALFVSHVHPDGQAHFNVYASPVQGQPWGRFTMDTAPDVAGPSYDTDDPQKSVTASKVSGCGDPPRTVLLARLRFKPDEKEPTTKL